MDDERPIDQFFGFLRLIGALTFLILGGIGLVIGLAWYLRPDTLDELDVFAEKPIVRLPAYEPKPTEAVTEDAPLQEELELLEGEYREAKTALESALHTTPGSAQITATDLGIVEGAIVEIVSALAVNPDNDYLQRVLMDTYRRQVNLMQKTLEIEGEQTTENVLIDVR